MYAKIFCQIFDSTIADDYEVRHIFQDLLVLADLSGVVNMTLPSIARRTNIPIDLIKRAIHVLESPDPRSRTPDCEGRRLIRLDERDWGWQIVNFAKYRAIASEEQRREVQRTRTAKFRERGGGHYSKWPATRARVLRRDEHICGYCGASATCVDHIIPLSRGGHGDDENLTAACEPCNNKKNNRTPEEANMKLNGHRVTPCNNISPSNAMQKQKQKQKQTQKEGEDGRNLVIQLRAEVGKHFNRSADARWSYEEEFTVAELARRVDVLKEWDEIRAFRRTDYKFHRTSVLNLLQNWTTELDRSRNQKSAPESIIMKDLKKDLIRAQNL